MAQNPIATLTMKNGGVMTIELYPDQAPNTVANFISLARKGFYNGLIFHRVIPGFVIQGGDPQGSGIGGPGYAIKGEFLQNGVKNTLKHVPGVLSMARTNRPDTAGSQFFVCVGDASFLDGQYAGFGMVTQGLDVALAVAQVPRDRADKPLEAQQIDTITVETFGQDWSEPKTLRA